MIHQVLKKTLDLTARNKEKINQLLVAHMRVVFYMSIQGIYNQDNATAKIADRV